MNVTELEPVDFSHCFAGEPAPVDPTADLARGRLRRRRRVAARVGVGGAAVVMATTAVLVNQTVPQAVPAGPADREPTATPSSPPSTPEPSEPPDTAPTLTWDGHQYLDRDGRSLGEIGRSTGPGPFAATTKNSWRVLRSAVDPQQQHLADYEGFAFTGGGVDGGGEAIGQKIGWTVEGEPGEGMIQLQVSRTAPGQQARPGWAHGRGAGLCVGFEPTTCHQATVAGIEVYVGDTGDGGFVMDRLQADGEVASVIVDPLFANNTTTPVSRMGISRADAARLLDRADLDVIG